MGCRHRSSAVSVTERWQPPRPCWPAWTTRRAPQNLVVMCADVFKTSVGPRVCRSELVVSAWTRTKTVCVRTFLCSLLPSSLKSPVLVFRTTRTQPSGSGYIYPRADFSTEVARCMPPHGELIPAHAPSSEVRSCMSLRVYYLTCPPGPILALHVSRRPARVHVVSSV